MPTVTPGQLSIVAGEPFVFGVSPVGGVFPDTFGRGEYKTVGADADRLSPFKAALDAARRAVLRPFSPVAPLADAGTRAIRNTGEAAKEAIQKGGERLAAVGTAAKYGVGVGLALALLVFSLYVFGSLRRIA